MTGCPKVMKTSLEASTLSEVVVLRQLDKNTSKIQPTLSQLTRHFILPIAVLQGIVGCARARRPGNTLL